MARIATYLREACFAWSATADIRSFVALVTYTALFHARNALKKQVTYGVAFSVRLRFDGQHECSLTLRPFAGDLFVLYEVLLHKAYYLPDDLLPTKSVRVIVDCGGNVGITALYLAARYPNATIYSVEPHPDTYAILKTNATAEPRVIPVHAAIVGKPTASVRVTACNPAWGNKLIQRGPGLEVPATTLCQLIEKYKLKHIDLLKIDIEGTEESLFSHGDFLPCVRLGMIELHDQYTKERLDADLAKWDFCSRPAAPEQGVQMVTFARQSLGWRPRL